MRKAFTAVVGTIATTSTIAAMVLTGSASANAAEVKFDRSQGNVFVSSSASQTSNTELYRATQGSGGVITFSQVGTGTQPHNGLAFHEASGYMFAINNNPTRGGDLLRVSADGSTAVAGSPIWFNSDQWVTLGAFGEGTRANTYFVGVGPRNGVGATPITALYRMNITAAGSFTLTGSDQVNLSQSTTATDLAWMDGALWGVESSGAAVRINPETGAVSRFSGVIPSATEGFGAMWKYGNGNLGVMSNKPGYVYQLKVANSTSASPTFTVLSRGTGPGGQAVDATYIPPTASVDLGLTKSAPATARAGDRVTYTLKVTNNGPAGSSGSVVKDTLPAGLSDVQAPSSCTVTSGQISCVLGALDVDKSETVTVSAVLPANFTGSVTNSATVLGNERDDNPANDTDTATTTAATASNKQPIAKADTEYGTVNTEVTLKPLQNDDGVDSPIDPSTLRLLQPAKTRASGDGEKSTTVTTPDGTWTVNDDSSVTFMPARDWTGTTTPLGYEFATEDGDTAQSTMTVIIAEAPASPAIHLRVLSPVSVMLWALAGPHPWLSEG